MRVRRHRQARRYTLRIHTANREVVLTMPPRGSLKEARAFAQKHGGWIAARLGRLPEPAPFAPGIVLPLRGVDHRIEHRRGKRGTVWTETGDGGRATALRRRRGAARRRAALRTISSARRAAIWKRRAGVPPSGSA